MVRALKHTEIGDIPVDWEIQTFEETFKILSNNTLSRENLNNRGGAVRNIHYGDVLTQFSEVLKCNKEEIPYINDLSLLSSSTQLLQDGDLIIADTAEDETVGKATEVQGLGDGKLVAGLHTIPCRVKKGDFVPGWLGYYMNSHMYHDQIIPLITGIKVSSISKRAIAETLIAVPPVDEQKQIVEILAQIDIVIQKEQEVVDKIMAVKMGCLSKMFPKEGANVPEMRLPEFCDAWETHKFIDNIISIQTGTNLLGSETNQGMPLLKMGNIQRGYFDVKKIEHLIDFETIEKENIANYGDFFINTRNTLELVGKGATWMGESGKYAFNSNIARFKFDGIDTFFFNYLYNTESVTKQIRARAVGTTSVAAIYPRTLDTVEYFLPALEEQKKIGEFFKGIDNLITLHQCKCEKYIGIKSGLISMLISVEKHM